MALGDPDLSIGISEVDHAGSSVKHVRLGMYCHGNYQRSCPYPHTFPRVEGDSGGLGNRFRKIQLYGGIQWQVWVREVVNLDGVGIVQTLHREHIGPCLQ